MEIIFQLLDADYVLLNGIPVMRLFGKTKEGKTVCAFYEKFLPYFYVLPKKDSEQAVIDLLVNHFKHDITKIEEASKFLPIGFQSKKTKMLRIFLKDPSRTPIIRDFLRKSEVTEDVYEADILFKYRFMADFDIFGMKWIKVTGKPNKTNTVKVDQTIAAEQIEPLDLIDNVDFRYISVDIEISTETGYPDQEIDKIAIISLSFYPAYRGNNTLVLVAKNGKKVSNDVRTFNSENEMLQEFLKIIDDYDPDVLVGYNINNFDLPYISSRLKKNRLNRAIGRCTTKPLIVQKIGENRFRNSIVGRIIADPYAMIREMVKRGFFVGLKRFGLGDVSKFFLSEEKIDVSHSEISKYWNGNEQEFRKLIDYARKDSELALKLLIEKRFLEKYIGVSLVSGLLLQDSLDTGESSKVENLLLRELNKREFVMPCKPTHAEMRKRENERLKKELKGAFVLEPKIGLYDKCVVYLDFTSMYPSIYIGFNICPTTLVTGTTNQETVKTISGTEFISPKIRVGVIPKIVRFLMEERVKVKTLMIKETDRNKLRALDVKQEALKRISNAFYGYTGYIKARLYALDIANAITATGRNFIQTTTEIISKQTKYPVIYGDTDSIMVKTDTTDLDTAIEIGREIESIVNQNFKGMLKLKIETVFRSLLILAKKRYAGWSFDKTEEGWRESVVMKGIETVRRDWCELTSKTLFNVLEILLKEQNSQKAFRYVKDILTKLERNEVSIEDLVILKSISKPLEQYKGIQPHVELLKKMKKRSPDSPGVGDRIGYVIVKGLQMTSQRAEDPEYVKTHNLKIDSKYYIESQLLPPLERVFDAIGISKSELIGMGKQTLLTDVMKNGVEKDFLNSIDGFICNKCNTTFRRVPLAGKCTNCSGEILFYLGEFKSRVYAT